MGALIKGRNHPAQVARRGMVIDDVDDRSTPDDLFGPLHDRFGFTVDAAAAPHNAKLPRYWTREDNGLEQSWADERIWCNPPYSALEPWVRKAWAERDWCPLVVLLLPSTRTEQDWWQHHIEPYRDRPRWNLRTEFLPGRPRFGLGPGQTPRGQTSGPRFGLVLIIFNGWDL
jgi:DNA N-6-adenine-methyltransferase (Dam)